MSKKLISFHGDQKIKDDHIARLQAHYDADEIIQGKYWKNGKGCDTGCSFHSSDHTLWETQLGIPIIIGYLRDRIFEGLRNGKAKEFPLACSKATPVGVDLNPVWRKFFIWLLVDETDGIIKFAKTERSKKTINDVAAAFKDSLIKEVTIEKWRELRNGAADVVAAAAAAAAAYAAAAYGAYGAAAYAAAAAAYGAADIGGYYAAAVGVKAQRYEKMSIKLIQLLQEAK